MPAILLACNSNDQICTSEMVQLWIGGNASQGHHLLTVPTVTQWWNKWAERPGVLAPLYLCCGCTVVYMCWECELHDAGSSNQVMLLRGRTLYRGDNHRSVGIPRGMCQRITSWVASCSIFFHHTIHSLGMWPPTRTAIYINTCLKTNFILLITVLKGQCCYKLKIFMPFTFQIILYNINPYIVTSIF